MVFEDALLIKSGGSNIEYHIDALREALINKDGLVPQEKKEDLVKCINALTSDSSIKMMKKMQEV